MTDKQLCNLLSGIRALALMAHPADKRERNDHHLRRALDDIAHRAEKALDQWWMAHRKDEL